MTASEKTARTIRRGDMLSVNGAEVVEKTYNSTQNTYRIEYLTKTGTLAHITIPANDLVTVWKEA